MNLSFLRSMVNCQPELLGIETIRRKEESAATFWQRGFVTNREILPALLAVPIIYIALHLILGSPVALLDLAL